MSLAFTGNFMSLLKSNFLAKFLFTFVILFGLGFARCKYLTKNHLKHSLSRLMTESIIQPEPFPKGVFVCLI